MFYKPSPSEHELNKLIADRYGSEALQFLYMYSQLDEGDRGEIRGELREKVNQTKAQVIEFNPKARK